MLCFLTVRKLKPGAYDDFRKAWEPSEIPEEWGSIRAYHLRNVNDENEIISFGLMDGEKGDLERLRGDERYQEERKRQVEEIEKHVESVGTDGAYEVIEEVKLGGN